MSGILQQSGVCARQARMGMICTLTGKVAVQKTWRVHLAGKRPTIPGAARPWPGFVRSRASIRGDGKIRCTPRIEPIGSTILLAPRTGVPDNCSVTFCLRVKHVFCIAPETSYIESRRIGRSSRPRLSNGPRTASPANPQPVGSRSHFPCERLRADELDSGTGPSEHDGSVGNQSPPSRAERE